MALTDAEKIKVRRYLGYNVNAPANDFIGRTLTDLTSAASTEISSILTQIAAIDTATSGAASNAARAGVSEVVGEVKFFGAGSSFSAQTGERDRLIDELASMLGVPRANRSGGGTMNFVGG